MCKSTRLSRSEFLIVKGTPLCGVQVTLVTASQLNVGRSKQTTFVNEREEVEKNHVADKLGHACAPKKAFPFSFFFPSS